MKKKYINPTMLVVRVATTQMLAASVDVSETNYNGTTTIEARGFDFDDDEEDY